MKDRRSLSLGVILLGLGAFFLLRRTVGLSGPRPILLFIGALFLSLSAMRSFRGPLLPAGVLLGLGAGFVLQPHLEAWAPRWAILVLGLGAGFLLVAALDAAWRRGRRLPAHTVRRVVAVPSSPRFSLPSRPKSS